MHQIKIYINKMELLYKKYKNKKKHHKRKDSVSESGDEDSSEGGIGPSIPEDYYEKQLIKEAQ